MTEQAPSPPGDEVTCYTVMLADEERIKFNVCVTDVWEEAVEELKILVDQGLGAVIRPIKMKKTDLESMPEFQNY